MMSREKMEKLNLILEHLAESLDISPSKYKKAVERYKSAGEWLESGEYDCVEKPRVGVQGSFRLGTVVRPLKEGKESGYDIDFVCELPKEKEAISPSVLKKTIGDRLNESPNYRPILEPEGTRCWTLEYAEEDGVGFHMDILPAVHDKDLANQAIKDRVPREYAQEAIAMTKKNENSNTHFWKEGGSNPWGYAGWFLDVNMPMLGKIGLRQKQLLFEKHGEIYASVDDVPEQLIRTPLQRAIQILKRHRDIRFLGHKWEKEKPISIIITTLSACAYQNEGDIYTALTNIVDRIHDYANTKLIQQQNGKWVIPNPVNRQENFADRWNDEGSHRAEAFLEWIDWLRVDIREALDKPNFDSTKSFLLALFGKQGLNIPMPIPSIVTKKNDDDYYKMKVSQGSNPSKPWGC